MTLSESFRASAAEASWLLWLRNTVVMLHFELMQCPIFCIDCRKSQRQRMLRLMRKPPRLRRAAIECFSAGTGERSEGSWYSKNDRTVFRFIFLIFVVHFFLREH